MKARILPLIGMAALMLALGAVMSSCDDGGGELTLDEYFEGLAKLDAEHDERATELEEKANEALASAESAEDAIKAFQDQMSGALEAGKDFVDGIDDLNPPAEAEEAHEAAVEAGREVIEAFEAEKEALDDAESLDDVDAAFSGDFETVAASFEQTCLALQAIADDNGIDEDLDCED